MSQRKALSRVLFIGEIRIKPTTPFRMIQLIIESLQSVTQCNWWRKYPLYSDYFINHCELTTVTNLTKHLKNIIKEARRHITYFNLDIFYVDFPNTTIRKEGRHIKTVSWGVLKQRS